MILLPEQFQMLIYHLLMGWLFGFFFSFENAVRLKIFKNKLGLLIEFIFINLFLILFYFLLFQLNGGVSHFYGLCLFILGVFIYFQIYFVTFSPFIKGFVNIFYSILRSTKVAFLKCVAIIDIRPKLRKWRKHIGEKRKLKRAKKKKAKEDSHNDI